MYVKYVNRGSAAAAIKKLWRKRARTQTHTHQYPTHADCTFQRFCVKTAAAKINESAMSCSASAAL